jgi:hypothetical protein
MQAGSTATFNVTLKNNDGSGCQPAGFSWQTTAPAGWTTSTPPVTFVNPGASTTTAVQVTSAPGTADGFYAVNISAENGSNSSSASATYSLVSTLAVTNTATQATYTRNQTATVNATVRAAGSFVSGASVTFTMTKSNGTTVSSTAITGANGVAVFKYSFNKKKDPTGTYQVRAQASMNGVSGIGSASFVVK